MGVYPQRRGLIGLVLSKVAGVRAAVALQYSRRYFAVRLWSDETHSQTHLSETNQNGNADAHVRAKATSEHDCSVSTIWASNL